MDAHFKVENPDNIKFTLTATMSLMQWRRIREALSEAKWNNTTATFRNHISDMIDQANKEFMRHEDDQPRD